jgi:hypothetical protein
MESFQTIIGEWAENNFKQSTVESVINHLKREVKEFFDNPCPEEAADIVLLLFHHAHKCGYNLMQEVMTKHDINTKRTWGPIDSEGVSEHIE